MSDPENKQNDFIFNLSLSEIAFIIILALVLLLGIPLKQLTQENQELTEENKELEVCKLPKTDPSIDLDEPQSRLTRCDLCVANVKNIPIKTAKENRELGEKFRDSLKKVATDQEVNKKIDECIKNIQVIDDYKHKVAQLENKLDKETKNNKNFEEKLRELKEQNTELKETEKQLIERNKNLTKDIESLSQNSLVAENQKLRLENNRLNYGDEYIPCMQGQTRKKNGEIDKWDSLFKVYMRDDDVVVRLSHANTLDHPALQKDKNIRALASELDRRSRERYIGWAEFETFAQKIDKWGLDQTPPCRMVVLMYNRITNVDLSDNKRLNNIEAHFYKQEIPRNRPVVIPEPHNLAK